MIRHRKYYIFILSLYSKLFSVINDFGVDWEHTFAYLFIEILILTFLRNYNTL